MKRFYNYTDLEDAVHELKFANTFLEFETLAENESIRNVFIEATKHYLENALALLNTLIENR